MSPDEVGTDLPNVCRETQAYQAIEVHPLAGAIGAEVLGVDLRNDFADHEINEIRRAFLEHQVIFFREQTLTPAEFERFVRRFGTLDPHHVLRGMTENPNVLDIVHTETDRYIFAPGWHADVTWQERPVLGAMLYGVEVPESGGDTLFANQYLAYEALSPRLRKMLDELNALHSSEDTYGPGAEKSTKVDLIKIDRSEAVKGLSVHPVVRTHPETKRKALFVNPDYTKGFENMRREESKPLLEYLYAHATRPEFTCRFRWRQGSIAFWDNRCTLHRPIDDYFGKRRRTWRITLSGDRPR